MIKFIHIDYRKPRNLEEADCFAITNADTNAANVYFNVNKHRKSQVLADTFFHEMAHIFFAFHGKTKQMTEKEEETLATKIGIICSEALR